LAKPEKKNPESRIKKAEISTVQLSDKTGTKIFSRIMDWQDWKSGYLPINPISKK
jgi:hypothetical protein